jgi:hypothetical protein
MCNLTDEAMRDTEGDGEAGSAYQFNVYGTKRTCHMHNTIH